MNNNSISLENKPLFSVIMPCYNSEEYVDRAIQSCLNQTFENWELIVVNDGSTDNTLNIINSYSQQDKRIRVFSKENGGYVSAVNYGLNRINGTYFLMMGSDDELLSPLFHEIYNHISFNRYPDMIGFKTHIKNSDGSLKTDKNSDFSEPAFMENSDIKDFSEKFPGQSSIFFSRDTSKMFKTDLLGDIRYLGKKGMDADGIFSMMIAHNAHSFLCVPVFGYLWYLRAESLSGRKKDFETQLDRINNWFQFGNELMKLDPSLITGLEKYYLIRYLFDILSSAVFYYFSDCRKNRITKKVRDFFDTVIPFFGISSVPKEIRFFLKHTSLWELYVFFKLFVKKIRKKLRK